MYPLFCEIAMNPRAIFPTIMFVLALASFAFGGWQYFQARSVQTAAMERMAFMITTIEQSNIPYIAKQNLYANITQDLPKAPTVFGLDLSSSFASKDTDDACTSDGQRTICRALKMTNTDLAVRARVCGACIPR
jgi:hypothetical protein